MARLGVTAVALLIVTVAAHLWFSTQTLRSRWHDIHPHRGLKLAQKCQGEVGGRSPMLHLGVGMSRYNLPPGKGGYKAVSADKAKPDDRKPPPPPPRPSTGGATSNKK